MKKILVVVDMQNDFITGPLGTPEAVSIVDNVVEKIRGEEWDYIYCTMDTHNDKYKYTQEGAKLPIEHCIIGTDGCKLNNKVFETIDYLYDNNKGFNNIEVISKNTFGSKTLVKLLEYGQGAPCCDIELTLVGVCTDICVISNALLLKAHYPEMKIVVDASCCAGSTPKLHKEALHVMKSCQIDIINESLYRPAGWTEDMEKLFVGDKESEE